MLNIKQVLYGTHMSNHNSQISITLGHPKVSDKIQRTPIMIMSVKRIFVAGKVVTPHTKLLSTLLQAGM